MRVLVCGSRDWPNTGWHKKIIFDLLTGLYTDTSKDEPFVLIEGGARGADSVAHEWGKDDKYHPSPSFMHLTFPADWDTYGKKAGYIRNAQMLKEGKPDVIFAFRFPGISKGTDMMVALGKQANVPTFVIQG